MTADRFQSWDAAYALGSLSVQDTASFELHLAACGRCVVSVGELRALTGMLALAPAWAFDTAPPSTSQVGRAPLGRLPRGGLLPAARHRWSRARRVRRAVRLCAVGALAAATAAVVTLAWPRASDTIPEVAPRQALSLSNVQTAPIEAKAQVVTHDTWARVDLWCRYTATGRPAGSYRLVARDKSGKTVQLGVWPAVPGQTAVLRVPTRLHTADIAAIEILSDSGSPVSRLSLTS